MSGLTAVMVAPVSTTISQRTSFRPPSTSTCKNIGALPLAVTDLRPPNTGVNKFSGYIVYSPASRCCFCCCCYCGQVWPCATPNTISLILRHVKLEREFSRQYVKVLTASGIVHIVLRIILVFQPVLVGFAIEKINWRAWSIQEMACSDVARLPTSRIGFNPQLGHSWIIARGNRDGRCRWSAGFIGELPFTPPFHSGAAQYSPHFTLTVSQYKTLKRGIALLNWLSILHGGGGKREIPDKTRRPMASSVTIPTSDNPGVTQLGIKPGSRTLAALPLLQEILWEEVRCSVSAYSGSQGPVFGHGVLERVWRERSARNSQRSEATPPVNNSFLSLSWHAGCRGHPKAIPLKTVKYTSGEPLAQGTSITSAPSRELAPRC
ncbi:hypothetical protein PR048_032085 [Dryococelus australis]|uniref:Uncharacterized protein n=1 Tax=Dryococelus australis TaxID=614101 RepID=A0ABQ9G181_9NEOP|nr:hypothetical protein PR048_032085 [Dryococelus australis]